MGLPDRPPSELEKDLAAMVNTTGRQPIAAAFGIWGSAGVVVLIVRTSGGQLTIAEWLAVLIVVAWAAPALLGIGLDWKRRTLRWAEDEQRLRIEQRAEALRLRAEVQALRAALEDPRGRRKPTSRQRALHPVDATQEIGGEE